MQATEVHAAKSDEYLATFIERPIATSLLMAAIALFGTVAYRALPVSDLPNVDFPTLLVTAALPGASPETMAAAVATPLENQFSTIAGLESMTSINSLGATQITLEFDLSRSMDGAAVDVQAAITQASRLLPPGMPTPPTFTKVNPADQPILYLALTSQALPLWTLDEYAETRVAQRISMVTGVAQVQVLGAQKYAVHVQMDPHALASRQIGINEVETALQDWNVNLPTGHDHRTAALLHAAGQRPVDAAPTQYRPLVVAYRNGIAGAAGRAGRRHRQRGGRQDRFLVLHHGRRAARDRARHPAPARHQHHRGDRRHQEPAAGVPDRAAAVGATWTSSTTGPRPSGNRINDVQFTMVLTLGLVVMVIFLFLRNFSATVIPSLALPFSIIGTFAVMYLLDYSLDNLSMMALILSVGFVVDDAIVMLENIVRHMEMGEKPLMRGAQRIERNRLHHRFDDAVAGRGVHSGAVHGRHAGTAVPANSRSRSAWRF